MQNKNGHERLVSDFFIWFYEKSEQVENETKQTKL